MGTIKVDVCCMMALMMGKKSNIVARMPTVRDAMVMVIMQSLAHQPIVAGSL